MRNERFEFHVQAMVSLRAATLAGARSDLREVVELLGAGKFREASYWMYAGDFQFGDCIWKPYNLTVRSVNQKTE